MCGPGRRGYSAARYDVDIDQQAMDFTTVQLSL